MNIHQLVDDLGQFIIEQSGAAPFVFGISGGQGAGKSTLCRALTDYLEQRQIRAVTLGLDDFYLPASARDTLARQIHPLCATRGVPGTHDIDMMKHTLAALQAASPDDTITISAFSKSHDERLPREKWTRFTGRPDVILLEGWCVGGRDSFISPQPQTQWETQNDPHGVWKTWTHKQAAAYAELWDACQGLLLIRQQDFDAVIDNRWRQEQDNAAESGVWQFASRAEVAAFCAHYESWTVGIWQNLPQYADFVIGRNADFTYHYL